MGKGHVLDTLVQPQWLLVLLCRIAIPLKASLEPLVSSYTQAGREGERERGGEAGVPWQSFNMQLKSHQKGIYG